MGERGGLADLSVEWGMHSTAAGAKKKLGPLSSVRELTGWVNRSGSQNRISGEDNKKNMSPVYCNTDRTKCVTFSR
jgi:hypothetical protein